MKKLVFGAACKLNKLRVDEFETILIYIYTYSCAVRESPV